MHLGRSTVFFNFFELFIPCSYRLLFFGCAVTVSKISELFHIEEEGTIHYNVTIWYTNFIPMLQALKISAAKAAVEKEWEKLEKIPAWNLTKVRSKKEVIDEARASSATVHFASLMDICHLKNAELEAKAPKVQRSSCTPVVIL